MQNKGIESNDQPDNNILLSFIREGSPSSAENLLNSFPAGTEIDWDNIIQEAKFHRIAPVIYQNLKDAHLPFIPDKFLKSLEAVYYSNLHRNIKYFSELERMLKSLNETGVIPIVLKGGAIADKIYNNIALRPIEDIDLLVRNPDLPATKEVFRRWGYEIQKEKLFPSKAHRDFEKEQHKPFEKFESEIHFFKNKREYFFDIHWNLLIMCDSKIRETIQLDMEKIWKRSIISSFGTSRAYLMSYEDLVLYLCLHLRERHFENGKSRLIWWFDIYQILKTAKDNFDWDYLISSATEYGAGKSVFPVLLTLKAYFEDAPLPLGMIKNANDKFEIFPVERILPAVESQAQFEKKYEEKDYLLEITKVQGIWGKIRLLMGDLFPDKEYMIFKYQIKNKKLLPFYYLLRIKNTIVKGFKAGVQLIKQ